MYIHAIIEVEELGSTCSCWLEQWDGVLARDIVSPLQKLRGYYFSHPLVF